MKLINQTIVIFGGTGSLGKTLINRLYKKNKLIIYSRDEAKHWTIKNELKTQKNIKFFIGDIRDQEKVDEVFLEFKPNIAIIASALKQVDTCEQSPFESIKTNVLGINNVINSTVRYADRLKKLNSVLLVSTDKACSPSNVYGMSKALAERLITSSSNENKNTKYIAVRYGNVLESRGSILPLFRFQGEFKSHLTVTHTNMTRFIMTLEESVDLIVSALLGATSGELWLPKLKSMKIIDLAEIFSEEYSKPIRIVGIRPGEKLHEDLISYSESMRVRDKNSFYIMQSSLENVGLNKKMFNYNSNQNLVSKKELKTYLRSIKVFDKPLDQFIGKKIDDLKTI
jgi:UDP-N-acetylglucosamine 4,6-dehydratase